jgi:hypothetical protein
MNPKKNKNQIKTKVEQKIEENMTDLEIYQIIDSNGPIAFPLNNDLAATNKISHETDENFNDSLSNKNSKLGDLLQEQLRTNSFLLNYPLKK